MAGHLNHTPDPRALGRAAVQAIAGYRLDPEFSQAINHSAYMAISAQRATAHAAIQSVPKTQDEFTLAEVGAAISRTTGLPPELKEVGELAGRLQSDLRNNPTLRAAGLTPSSVMNYVMAHMSREMADRMDAGKRAELERQQAKSAGQVVADASMLASFGRGIGAFAELGARGGNTSGSSAKTSDAGGTAVAGVSAATFDRYARAYAGMGFDQQTIGNFAKVGLQASDFRDLEKRWGRQEVVKGAERASEWGLRGRQGVDDVSGISGQEDAGWRKWRRHGKGTQGEREAEEEIRTAPRRPGESEEQFRGRFDRLKKGIKKEVLSYNAEHGSASTREATAVEPAKAQAPAVARQMGTASNRDVAAIDDMFSEEPTAKPKMTEATTPSGPSPAQTTARRTDAASPAGGAGVTQAATPADKSKEVKVGVATQAKKPAVPSATV